MEEVRGSVKRSAMAIVTVMNKLSEQNFTGEVEFTANMNQGGVTRVKVKSTSEILGSQTQETRNG